MQWLIEFYCVFHCFYLHWSAPVCHSLYRLQRLTDTIQSNPKRNLIFCLSKCGGPTLHFSEQNRKLESMHNWTKSKTNCFKKSFTTFPGIWWHDSNCTQMCTKTVQSKLKWVQNKASNPLCERMERAVHLTLMVNVAIHDVLHAELCLNGRSTIKAS